MPNGSAAIVQRLWNYCNVLCPFFGQEIRPMVTISGEQERCHARNQNRMCKYSNFTI